MITPNSSSSNTKYYTTTYSIIVDGKICKTKYVLNVDEELYDNLAINDTLDLKTKRYFENK